LIVWALFDSGNGCYAQAAKEFPYIELYSVGLDIEGKHDHFISLNLADYSHLFGQNGLFETLDQLPDPDLIIASPPCESWSVASAMKDGNDSWKQEKGDGLFESQTPLSRFTIRDYRDYDRYQYKPEKSLLNRINGELCTFNTIQIIKRYDPQIYIIENPTSSRMWEYIEKVLGFSIPFDNLTYYNNYGYPAKKATKFKSNIDLGLRKANIPNELGVKRLDRKGGAYNARSNIPFSLIKDIFNQVRNELKVN
jgi:hypothetical protein